MPWQNLTGPTSRSVVRLRVYHYPGLRSRYFLATARHRNVLALHFYAMDNAPGGSRVCSPDCER